jgi:hypothetical protein
MRIRAWIVACLAAAGVMMPAEVSATSTAAVDHTAAAAAAAGAKFYNCYPNVARDSQAWGQPVPECHMGPFVIQEPRTPLVYNDFVVTDPNDAAQLWQGLNGLFEGTAPFCSTDKSLIHMAMCAGGELNGRQAGIGNPVINLWETARTTEAPYIAFHLLNGTTEVLTPYKLRLLDAMAAAGITPRDLRALAAMLHAEGK